MNREQGLKILEEMVGDAAARKLREGWAEIHPDLERYIVGFLAGEVWSRPQLDRRTKSLCTIAVLAALGRPRGLELNFRMALNNGATRQEILETLLHIAPYAGFPAAWEAMALAREVLSETEADRP